MNWLTIKILNKILSKPCPDRIPRSGCKGIKINCYSMEFYEGKNPKLLIRSVNKFGYEGDHWAVDQFANKASVPFDLGKVLNSEILTSGHKKLDFT